MLFRSLTGELRVGCDMVQCWGGIGLHGGESGRVSPFIVRSGSSVAASPLECRRNVVQGLVGLSESCRVSPSITRLKRVKKDVKAQRWVSRTPGVARQRPIISGDRYASGVVRVKFSRHPIHAMIYLRLCNQLQAGDQPLQTSCHAGSPMTSRHNDQISSLDSCLVFAHQA